MLDVVALLVAKTGFSQYDIMSIAGSAPKRYKVFYIAKRSGGLREIAQPARELKTIQRVIVEEILLKCPIHQAATAYRIGLSIRHNVQAHSGLTPLLKLDFKDFFPSIVSEDWETYCRKNLMLDDQNIKFTSQLLFRRRPSERNLRLSVGAPSSPILSNILLFDFDQAVAQICNKKGIRYTRYADDMTFSGQRIGMLKDVQKDVQQILRQITSPNLKINSKKTTFVTASYRRRVTGLVIDNNVGTVGVGRDERRAVSAAVHHASLGKLDADAMQKLCGRLAFINVVEPALLKRLEDRYGKAVILQIKRSVKR